MNCIKKINAKAAFSFWNTLHFTKFTLIELLFVIAIMIMLISLLLPALNSARERSRSIVCQGNLKQIGFASIQYANDFDGWGIASITYGTGNIYDLLDFLRYVSENRYVGEWKPGLQKAIGIFKCPSRQDTTYTQTAHRIDYGVNVLLAKYIKYSPPWQYRGGYFKMSTIKDPTRIIYWADCREAPYLGRINGWEFDDARHDNDRTINSLFIDFHVQNMRRIPFLRRLDAYNYFSYVTPPAD